MIQKIPLWLRVWLFASAILLLICGLAYALSQQVIRMSANDPQIQIAEDASALLSQGTVATDLVPQNSIDITNILDTFIIIYDDQGQAVTGSGQLKGEIPVPPEGVFDYVRSSGHNRFTWQPEQGVRIAAVVERYFSAEASGFVLVGRSLREVEQRETMVLLLAITGWLACFIISLILSLLFFRKPKEDGREGEKKINNS